MSDPFVDRGKVVTLKGEPLGEALNAEPNESVITSMTRFLEDAKSGKLQGLMLIGIDNKGDYAIDLVGTIPFLTGLGAIEVLKDRSKVLAMQAGAFQP